MDGTSHVYLNAVAVYDNRPILVLMIERDQHPIRRLGIVPRHYAVIPSLAATWAIFAASELPEARRIITPLRL